VLRTTLSDAASVRVGAIESTLLPHSRVYLDQLRRSFDLCRNTLDSRYLRRPRSHAYSEEAGSPRASPERLSRWCELPLRSPPDPSCKERLHLDPETLPAVHRRTSEPAHVSRLDCAISPDRGGREVSRSTKSPSSPRSPYPDRTSDGRRSRGCRCDSLRMSPAKARASFISSPFP
jgi:hypothetical protein